MENRRKLVHISMIVFALLIGTMPPIVISLCCLAALLFNIFLLPRFSNKKLERNGDLQLGFSPGLILYPAVLFVISIIFFEKQIFLLLAWGALAFGDGFANLIGRYYGHHKLAWNQKKSWEGFLAFLFFGFTATMLLLLILPDSLRLGLPLNHWFLVLMFAILLSAVFETVPDTVDDNLIVPFLAAFSGYFLHLALQTERIMLPDDSLYFFLIALILGSLSLLTRKITVAGAVTGSLITFALMLAFGTLGLVAIGTFFVVGTATSAWKKNDKQRLGLAESNAGKRGYSNVLANASVPFFVAILYLFSPPYKTGYEVIMMSSFAAALSDTVSSELGNVYGRYFINVRTLRKGERGKDGMISLEGSLAGMLGALLMGYIYFLVEGDCYYSAIIVFAGFAGNLSDSLMGATLQKNGFLNNHTVNFFNTLIAALLAYSFLNFGII